MYGGADIGAWAYRVPAFGIQRTGIERGDHIERFELTAVLEGVEMLAAVDHSARPIHVHTDSSFVMTVLKHAVQDRELPSRRSYDRVRDLFVRGVSTLRARVWDFSLCNGDSLDHRFCHAEAQRAIREHVRGNLPLARQGVIKREEQSLKRLLSEREQLERRLQTVEAEIARSTVTLRGLQQLALEHPS
jgi:hypothetical protein